MEAASRNQEIRGLILIYPAFVLFDDARALFQSVDEIPPVYNHRGNDVGKVYFERSLSYDIFDDIEKIKIPVLIFHGKEDDIAPISYSERASEVFQKARLISLENTGHFFNDSQIQSILPDMLAFLQAETRE